MTGVLLAGGPSTPSVQEVLVAGYLAAPLVAVVAGFVLLARGRRGAGALALGLASLGGLYDPLLLGAGVAALLLGWRAWRHTAGAARFVALAAVLLGVAGSLASLVFPAIVVYVWLYAAFHGGRLPV